MKFKLQNIYHKTLNGGCEITFTSQSSTSQGIDITSMTTMIDDVCASIIVIIIILIIFDAVVVVVVVVNIVL